MTTGVRGPAPGLEAPAIGTDPARPGRCRAWPARPVRLPPGRHEVTCAVSGGADSLALLALAVEAGCR